MNKLFKILIKILIISQQFQYNSKSNHPIKLYELQLNEFITKFKINFLYL